MVYFRLVKRVLFRIINIHNTLSKSIGIVPLSRNELEASGLCRFLNDGITSMIDSPRESKQAPVFTAFVHRIHAIFRSWVVQREVEVGKLSDLVLWNGHTNNFAMPEFPVVCNALEIMIAHSTLIVRSRASSISGSRSQFVVPSAENFSFAIDKFMLNMPKAPNPEIERRRDIIGGLCSSWVPSARNQHRSGSGSRLQQIPPRR
mmetsp:Transcript_68002/g.102564  ORF Transcript_68002/g.102564 Transcript_68002/m.102564 type:complete len:204 (-) Transcript_68002:75-686(-)